MAPSSSKGKNISINWREASLEGSTLILSVVKEAATFSPFSELRRAASVALVILKTIQAVKVNKEAYERLGDDSGGLVAVIWRSYKKAEVKNEWLSADMRDILEDLTQTLENISSFVQEQLSRRKTIRVIFSRADATKISEYREHLNYAMQKFELQSHMNINEVLLQIVRKNEQISEQILNRNDENAKRTPEITAREAQDRQEAENIDEEVLKTVNDISIFQRMKEVENDRQVMDERWHSYELKKIEKETNDRQSELERLRETASTVELANRLKKAQEEEITELRRKIAAADDSQRRTSIQAPSSKKKKGSKRQYEVEEEEDSPGNVEVEKATLGEEEEIGKLRRKFAAAEDNRRRTMIQASSSKKKNSSRQQYETKEDSDCGGNIVVEEPSSGEEEIAQLRRRLAAAEKNQRRTRNQAPESKKKGSRSKEVEKEDGGRGRGRGSIVLKEVTLGEEQEVRRPMKRDSKAKRNPSNSPKRRSVVLEDETDDDVEDETEDQSAEEHYTPPTPRRKSPKVNRKPPPGNLSRDIEDLMAQFRGFAPSGLGSPYEGGSKSRPESPMHLPMYGSPLSPSMGPYGYGAGMPGMVVNSGVGNVTNSTISNFGNDNSVKKVYHHKPPRSYRRAAGN